MKQLLSLVIGLLIGGALIFFYMNTKLKKYNNLQEMSFVPKSQITIMQDIGRTSAHTLVTNYQTVTGLPIKGLRFSAAEIASIMNPTNPGSKPDEIIVYFGKKTADVSRKGDYTAIIGTVKSNTQQDGYYADQASPCPSDCPTNAIGN